MAHSNRSHAFRLFFPAAAIHAALVVPLTLFTAYGDVGWAPGLTGTGHGHELIFGFALALVAGYTLGPQPRQILWPLLGLWLVARAAWLLAPELWLSQLASPAFALALAWRVVPKFQAAKKWRNRITGPLILVICLVPLIWVLNEILFVLPAFPWRTDSQTLLHFGVLCLLLLMTFMGGRLIAPAAAGTLDKKGIPLQARVQPRVEAVLLVVLLTAALLYLAPATRPLTGLLLVAAAMLILIRAFRWKLWHCGERPDLLVLALGYGWLAAGSLLTSADLVAGRSPAASLHLVTIGALGTLSSGIMLRLHFQRHERRPPPSWVSLTLGGLMAIAALSRFSAGAAPYGEPGLLWLSASAWAAGYLLAALIMVRPSSTVAHNHP